MNVHPSLIREVIRGAIAIVSASVALFLIVVAALSVGGFIWPDSGGSPGNAGRLMVALFYLVLGGPFAGIAFVLGAPLISDDPRFRGADT